MILEKVVTVGKETEVQQLAAQVGRQVFAADDYKEALEVIKRVNPELVLLERQFAQEFCNASDKNHDVCIAVIDTDENSTHSGEQFIRMGAHYYLRGKQDYQQLQEIISKIKNKLENFVSTDEKNKFFADDLAASVCMVGNSEAAKHTLRMIKIVANSQCNPLLIVGETGTGKEVAARAVHSIRHPNQRFVAVNCAALTANLLESELFGHVKGAFTGADSDKTGLLELAGEGTIFLDEITEMPTDLQAKLLRVLQEKTFRKVGGTKEINCRATIIASSNRNLKSEVKANRLRSDLYYRLNIFPIIIAPLRAPERQEDIPLLIKYFLKTLCTHPEKTKITAVTKLAMEVLIKHDWPGNVRELRNVIERAVLLETTDKIGLSSIVLDPIEFRWFYDNATPDKIKDFSLAKAEQELILKALQSVNWQKTQAAELLGISRATLYAKVKQYSIKEDSCASADEFEKTHTGIPSPVFANSTTAI
jgi:DNA-binding NtrC family response regulator